MHFSPQFPPINMIDRLQDAELEARAAALRRGVNAGLRSAGYVADADRF